MSASFIEAEPGFAGPEFFRPLVKPVRFLLVRHGQSEGNARGIVQGRLDLPLDATGRAQAAALGPWIAAQGPSVILASPLARAAETARIVRAACASDSDARGEGGAARAEFGARLGESNAPGPRFRLESLLAELDTGPFTGLSLDEAAQLHPMAHAGFLRESWDGVPGAEASIELYARAIRAWELLREEAIGGASVVVAFTHGGFLQWLIKATMGVRTWMPLFPMGNCGVSELDVRPQPGAGLLLAWRRIDFHPQGVMAAVSPVF
ncbi:MAG TPA: histidine phosphatase family protein [Rectinemataceae bacterium]|nr:histidine phosphatase family protein [Rectinemataceae bacterium]